MVFDYKVEDTRMEVAPTLSPIDSYLVAILRHHFYYEASYEARFCTREYSCDNTSNRYISYHWHSVPRALLLNLAISLSYCL